MQLISLSDFVLEQKNIKQSSSEFKETVLKYAKFLKQDLELSMFLPCDKEGKPFKGKPLSPNSDSEWIRWENEQEDFFKAKALVLFENVTFETVESQKGARFYYVGNTQVFNLSEDGSHLYWHHYTIESLLSEMDETIIFDGSF